MARVNLIFVSILACIHHLLGCSDIKGIRSMESSDITITTDNVELDNNILKHGQKSVLFIVDKNASNSFWQITSNLLQNLNSLISQEKPSGSQNTGGWPLTPVIFPHPIQSPVDLVSYKSITMELPFLDIVESGQQGVRATLYNSGHTVFVYIKEDPSYRPFLKGGPLREKFIFEQMHFHWGSEDIWGSEHFVDGESYAVEIHMVHYNSKYSSFEKAAVHQDGLSVLTVFAETSQEENKLLEPLDCLLANVSEAGSHVTLDSTMAMQWPASALQSNTEYYTYPGSLTTPPYSENVVFILLPKPITLSAEQLSAFRSLHSDGQGGRILDNKRQLQPLHNRPIVRSIHLQ